MINCVDENFIVFANTLQHTCKEKVLSYRHYCLETDAVIHSLRDSVTDRSNSYENCKLKCRKVSASLHGGSLSARLLMRADSFMNFWVDQMILAFIYVPNKRTSALFVYTVYEILMRLLQRYKPNDKFSISDFALHITTRT